MGNCRYTFNDREVDLDPIRNTTDPHGPTSGWKLPRYPPVSCQKNMVVSRGSLRSCILTNY